MQKILIPKKELAELPDYTVAYPKDIKVGDRWKIFSQGDVFVGERLSETQSILRLADHQEQTYGNISWEVKEFPLKEKNFDSFIESLKAVIRRLWAGEIGYEAFLDLYNEAIKKGLHEALIEGALIMGFNPLELNIFDRSWADREIMEQLIFVPALALFILANNKFTGYPLESLYKRTDMWGNQYEKLVNQSKAKYGGDQKLVWLRGNTKKPCFHCLNLNNIVALASDWDSYPLSPRSWGLDCKGVHCKCGLYATSRPLTRGGIPVF